MNITLKNNATLTDVSVLGGKEQYQNARRDYLEFIVKQAGHTVEELEGVLSAEHCAEVTLTDAVTGAQFIHSGYILRGSLRVYCDEDDVWKIAVRRYQRTDMEREVAALRENVAALMAKAQK